MDRSLSGRGGHVAGRDSEVPTGSDLDTASKKDTPLNTSLSCSLLMGVLLLACTSNSKSETPVEPSHPAVPKLDSARWEWRLDSISRAFLGKPYRMGPLGEGDSSLGEAKPRWRTDSFDCVTYIETMEALARAHTESQAKGLLDSIRYDQGQVRWEHRNHFTEADWLPANAKAGHVRLDTLPGFRWEPRTLARQGFYGQRGFHRLDTTVQLPMLPREQVLVDLAKPSAGHRIRGIGLVGKIEGYAILHTGFLVERKGQLPVLRHASQSGTVREQPLVEYLRDKPKFVGIVVWTYLP